MPTHGLRSRRHLLPWLLAGVCLSPCAQAANRYEVSVSPGLEHWRVKACFDTPAPDVLVAHAREAGSYLTSFWARGALGERSVTPREGRIELGALAEDGCVEYAVHIARAVQEGWRSGAQRVGADGLVLSPDLWLWYPYRGGTRQPLLLRFELPAGIEVAGPWPPAGVEDAGTVYRLGDRPYEWASRMVLGRLSRKELCVGDAAVEVVWLPGEPAASPDGFVAWLRAGARGLAALYGGFPVPRVQVLIVPIGRGDEPVPWGQVMRGGGDAVHLFIDQRRPLEAFHRDWTLSHELSHLLHPFIEGGSPWVTEGLASYYQEVSRARAGVLPPERAWEELHAGFLRGIRGTPQQQTLAEVSENMRRNRRFMRVYWSGAAIALLADVELRERSGGRQSLAGALGAFSRCCLPANRGWTAREFLDKLDELTGGDVLARLYERHVSSTAFPDLEGVYRRLGLRAEGGLLRLDDRAPAAEIRRGIMEPSRVAD